MLLFGGCAKILFYEHSSGVYKICKDRDGYIVYKPNGGQDVHGTGYSWDDVKSQYGLGSYDDKSNKSYTNCP